LKYQPDGFNFIVFANLETARGDMLLIRSCGAYAQSMSLRYNLRNPAQAFFLHGDMHAPFYHKSEPSKLLAV